MDSMVIDLSYRKPTSMAGTKRCLEDIDDIIR